MLNPSQTRSAMDAAVQAARKAGALMRKNLNSVKRVNTQSRHDIKLELDVRCQTLIEQALRRPFPEISLLGEEGTSGDLESEYRWVVDPIDGTVNFTYGLPHACVSIALQQRATRTRNKRDGQEDYETLAGVVYDPFLNELWTAQRGQRARLNGSPVRVSRRRLLREAIVAMGFAKFESTRNRMLPVFLSLLPRVRKVRLLGAAALSMTWVAAGRMDAYKEYGVRLWDIAAGGLIVECAGGEFWRRPIGHDYTYEILVSNGLLRKPIESVIGNIK